MSTAPRQHTPGPWNGKAIPEEGTWLLFGGRGTGGSNIGPSDANLYLITAAPEMLAALHSIATDSSAIYSGANAHIGDIARAAIARATGGNAL